MIATALLLATLGPVHASGAAVHVSEYPIESIMLQEAVGLIRTVGESDELQRIKHALSGTDLTRQRILEIARAVRASANTIKVRHPSGGHFRYSYSGTIKGIRFERRTDISPGRLTTSVRLSGNIRTESQRQGPAIGTGTLTGVVVTLGAIEHGHATTVLVRCGADVAVSVRGESKCRLVNRIVRNRAQQSQPAQLVRKPVSDASKPPRRSWPEASE